MMLLKSACNSKPRRTNLTGVGRGSSIEEISRRHIDKEILCLSEPPRPPSWHRPNEPSIHTRMMRFTDLSVRATVPSYQFKYNLLAVCRHFFPNLIRLRR
jgi:hypothetical protein